MDDVPEGNGTEHTTETIERMSQYLKSSEDDVITTYDMLKRQGMLTNVTRGRYGVDTTIKAHIYLRKIKEPTLNSLARGLYTDLNVVVMGDYITFEDKYSKVTETYLIQNKPEPYRTYSDSYMIFCNEKISWVDENKNIKTYPTILSHDKYMMGIHDEGTFEREDSWIKMIIQANPDTLKINSGDRFIFRAEGDVYHSAFEVMESNPHALKGLIIIKIDKTKINSDDNLTLGIANYYSKMETPQEPEVVIGDINGAIEVYQGTTNVYEYSGSEIDTLWKLEGIVGTLTIEQYTDMSVDGTGRLNVKIDSNANCLGYEFDIILEQNNVELKRKRVKVVSW